MQRRLESTWILAAMFVVSACDSEHDTTTEPRDAGLDAADFNADGYGSPLCDLKTADRFSYYADADGDGYGDPAKLRCAAEKPPTGYSADSRDCDDADAQRSPEAYERFGDGVDSNCDQEDDPVSEIHACSCEWRVQQSALDLKTQCEHGFEPTELARAVSDWGLSEPSCLGHADLALAFVAQCDSTCSEGPVYFVVANVGDKPSKRAEITLSGDFRWSPPKTPLVIEPLAPGARTAVIETLATGTYTLFIAAGDDECDVENNTLHLVVGDRHCGFDP